VIDKSGRQKENLGNGRDCGRRRAAFESEMRATAKRSGDGIGGGAWRLTGAPPFGPIGEGHEITSEMIGEGSIVERLDRNL
jgi:hypothetical protein